METQGLLFLNAVNKNDGRLVKVELLSCESCQLAVYHKHDPTPPKDWQKCYTELQICQYLHLNGCEDALELMQRVCDFARRSRVEFVKMNCTDMAIFMADQDKQADSNDRPTFCPEP